MGAKQLPSGGRVVSLHPDAVKVDLSLQQRAGGIDRDRVADLLEVLASGHVFQDRPVAFRDRKAGTILLAGGFHRDAAAKKWGKSIEYEVRDGSFVDALRYALGDNATHLGVPRTNADRQKAVHTALARREELGDPTDREIDEMCRVAIGYTSRMRKGLTGEAPDAAKSAAAQKGNAERAAKKKGAGLPHPDTNQGESDGEGGDNSGGRRGDGGGGVPDGVRPAAVGGRDDDAGPGGGDAHDEGLDGGGRGDQPRDRCGRLIPPYLVSTFEAGRAIAEAAAAARSAKAKADRADRDEAVGGFLKRNPGIGPALTSAAAGLARAVPYCVCPACDGDGDAEQCPTCGGCGWLNFAQYEGLPATLKEQANSFRPGDSWEGDDEPEPPTGPAPAFTPPGPGLDGLGQKIPRQLRDVFADEWSPSLASRLRQDESAGRSATAWNPWVKAEVVAKLSEVADHLNGARPFAVCDGCGGKGCEACLTAGFFPAWMQHELTTPERGK